MRPSTRPESRAKEHSAPGATPLTVRRRALLPATIRERAARDGGSLGGSAGPGLHCCLLCEAPSAPDVLRLFAGERGRPGGGVCKAEQHLVDEFLRAVEWQPARSLRDLVHAAF